MKIRTIVLLILSSLLAACTDASAWRNDPTVAAVRDACKSGSGVDYNCIERQAVTALNPEICRLAGIGIDDMCLQAVYEAADDPSICDRIYLRGVVPNCRAYYASPSSSPDLSAFYGNKPPAASLIVGEKEQVAGVGTSTWTSEKKGQEQTIVHGDAFALVTPVQSLVVPESFSAILRLPTPAVPSTLWYALKPVNDTIVRSSDQGTTRWQVSFLQPGTSLDLKSEQEISFSLDPGQYLLEVFAEWPVLGSADYGFFLEVQPETNSSTPTTSLRQMPTQLTPLLPTWTVTPVGASDLDLARHTLLAFFTLLHDGHYAEALPLYGGDYDTMREQNPDGTRLASVARDGTLMIWDLASISP